MIVSSNRILRMSGHAWCGDSDSLWRPRDCGGLRSAPRPWLHAKLGLVAVLLFFHIRLAWRLSLLERERGEATRREFSIVHGIVSLLMLLILIMVLVKPSF